MIYSEKELIKHYKFIIYEKFKKFKQENIKLDNYKLAYIAELYSCILATDKYKHLFYHYDDVPIDYKSDNNLSKHDTGIDYLNLKDIYGQCKLRKNTLTWTEMSTFIAHLWCKKTMKGMLSYNDNIKFSEQLELYKNTLILEPFNRDELIRYCENIIEDKKLIKSFKIYKEPEIILRDYQHEAIKILKDNENPNEDNMKNIIFNLPTGSGKTVIMAYSINLNLKYLILVPRIILLEQTKDKLLKINPELKGFIHTLGDNSKSKYNEHTKVVICVYNSIDKIIDNINDFNKVYIDEAHHILKPSIYIENMDFDIPDKPEDIDDLEENDDATYIDTIYDLKYNSNCVYFSATIDDMNDEDEMIEYIYYKKDIRYMIDNGYLTDYEIHFPIFSDENDYKVCEYLIARCNHYIIYCCNSEKGKDINSYLNKLLPGCSGYIDCKTSKSDRKKYIKQYNMGQLLYLVNVRVLTEGFDAPITQGICLLHIPSSEKMTIQVIGRALRLHHNKPKAIILIPVLFENECKDIAKVFKMICENDTKYIEKFKNKKYSGFVEVFNADNNDNNKQENNNDLELSKSELLYELVFDKFGNELDNCDAWHYKLGLVKEFIDTNKKRPSTISKNKDEKTLGIWISNQLYNYKNRIYIMTIDKIYNSWESFVNDDKYKEYFLSNKEQWYIYLEQVKKFINKNNKRPSKRSENTYEKSLGFWIIYQVYKNKNSIMKKKYYKDWINFINNEKYKEYFLN